MKTIRHNAAFTLSELLVATALSGLVLAMFLTLLVRSMGLWREGLARLNLSEQSRITRERVLHGINGQFGLRHASRAQLSYSTNQVAFSEISTNATNAFILFFDTNQPAIYSSAADKFFLSRNGALIDTINIAGNGNFLTIDVALAITNGQKKYTQAQQIRVYLLNE